MKLSLAIIFSITVYLKLPAQITNYNIDFEDTSTVSHVTIDSSNPNNLWQIGSPQKNVFTSVWSVPNVIVTDTANTYPTNDTSIFEITNIADLGYEIGHTVVLGGYYYVDCDSITDYGTIEVSPDNGITWIDIVNDTIYSAYHYWISPPPVFTGNSNGWVYFLASLEPLGPLFNVMVGDTIRYRFTFISDSIQTNRDGLMFDDLHFEDWAENIEEISPKNLVSITPVPTKDVLQIAYSNLTRPGALTVINSMGQTVYYNPAFAENTLDVSYLIDGTYFLLYSDGEISDSKRFAIVH